MRPAAFLVVLALGCGGGGSPAVPDAGTPDAEPPPDPARVDTSTGPVVGVVGTGERHFLGIPFAAPPTGGNRWRAPQPVAPWSAPLDASQFGPGCPQINTQVPDQSEDCLTINVWTPWPLPEGPLPVMLFIYGGSFITGASSTPLYDGAELARKGVIVASLNYRLGPFGFLSRADLDADGPSGNYGLQDQQAGMAWLKREIAAFGGDPATVTIWGESAGGFSVCAHLVSPSSNGLFQRAIIESGACGRYAMKADAAQLGDDLATALGCSASGAGTLTCMRNMPVADVLNALPLPNQGVLGAGARWRPNVDGVVLPEQPADVFAAGGQADVPVLLGANDDEGTIFTWSLLAGNFSQADYDQYTAAAGGDQVDALRARYPLAAYPTPNDAIGAMLADGGFVCPARRLARWLSDVGNPTYLYHFSYAFNRGLVAPLGAFHGEELFFIFGTTVGGLGVNDTERPLADAVQGYWTRFAAAGDPNGGSAVAWPAYHTAEDAYLKLDIPVETGLALLTDVCDFWDTL